VQGTPTTHLPEAEPTPVRRGRKRWVALVLGLVLSIVLPILAFQGIDVSESWSLALNCRGSDLVLAGFCFMVTLWLRAWRWRYLLAAKQDVPVRSCLSATCVGFFANNVLPFRLGELVRVRSLRQLEGISAATVLGTVAVERIFDILALVFMLGGYLVLTSAGQHTAQLIVAGQVALIGGAVLSVGLAVGYWRRRWLQRLIATPLAWLKPSLADKAAGLAGRFLDGLQVFASARQVLQVIVLSAAVWGVSVFSCYYVGQGLGLGLRPEHYVVVVFTVAFGAVIPAAPGAVGTYHGFARLGLYLVAVQSGEAALAFAAVLHALEWVLVTLAGLFFLGRDRLQLVAPARPRAEPLAA
jgi:uncharacterized protein (TIRG00374 family)